MTRSKSLEIIDRDARILEMVSQGYTQRQIAETMGISAPRVNQVIKANREVQDDDATRDRMATVLDLLMEKATRLATGRGRRVIAASGVPVYESSDVMGTHGRYLPDLAKPLYDEYANLEAMDKIVKLMDRYSRLYGLDVRKPIAKEKEDMGEYESAMVYVQQLREATEGYARDKRELLQRLARYESIEADIPEAEVVSTEEASEDAQSSRFA